MESESVLIIPQDYLEDFIKIIRFGKSNLKVDDQLEEQLENWCQEEERLMKINDKYLKK